MPAHGIPFGRQNVSDEAGSRNGWSAAVESQKKLRHSRRHRVELLLGLCEDSSPNYQVQRPATARLARGRDSVRVRVDAERPRLALYISPVRCNAELGDRGWI
jgi:hypothetical protein